MKLKRTLIIAWAVVVAGLFFLAGCGLPGTPETVTGPDSEWMTDSGSRWWPRPAPKASRTITSQSTGTDGGYYYTFWVKNGASGASMTLDGANGYTARWNGCPDFTCGKGWSSGSKNRVVKYKATYNAQSGGAIGLYGWIRYNNTQSDGTIGIEYYVVDQIAKVEGPYNNNDGQFPELKGTVYSDGDTYNIYTHVRNDDNALGGGKAKFRQWISIRQTKRTSGTITFKNHYNAWKQAGMVEGNMNYYQIILIEGWPAKKGPNSNNVGNATVTILGEGADTPPTAPSNLAGTWVREDVVVPNVYSFHGYKINLTWKAGTDNCGVDRHQVYRVSYREASIAGYLQPNATSMVERLSDSMYKSGDKIHYNVVAVDTDGNHSPQSNTFTFTYP